jgi:ATP-dependent helicase/nuclease subunit A
MLDTDSESPRADTMSLLVEWPGESPVPRKLVFLASETSPPPCAAGSLAAEQAERGREELNALYVAMTRAKSQLIISSVQPFRQAPGSAWQRISPLAMPATGVEPGVDSGEGDVIEHEAGENAGGRSLQPFYVPDLPYSIVEWSKSAIRSGVSNVLPPPSTESRIGQAMHWLLETVGPSGADASPLSGAGAGHGADAGTFGEMRLAHAERAFQLTPAQVREATRLAQDILAGEGAWAWDAAAVDWQGNEVELLHQGRLLRLDRLVHRTVPKASAGWWVLDYKMTTKPEQQPALVTQLLDYRVAVQAAYPDEKVTVAFLTGDGRQVVVEEPTALNPSNEKD